jgi:O-antigen/teichoic acid export membrane protein
VTTILEEEPMAEAVEPLACRGDTLAASVVILLVMTVAQRLIGFGRGILFCRWMEPEQLGQWDVAFGFLNLAASVAVLGLPGSFGRYVEYFRQRGHFHSFLRRTSLVTMVMSLVAAAVMVVERDWFSRLIFGSDIEARLVAWLALCLSIVIVHNYLTALFIAVRRYRIVTVLQFFQSLGFALISLGLLVLGPNGATSAIIGYGVATILSAAGSSGWLRELVTDEPPATQPVPHGAFWSKLMPFAIWMWMTNLLANLFDLIDRYMIVHHSGMGADEALRQIGFYHSSRIVPLLFVAIAGLLGSMITPHLSHDWELGRRRAVVRRLNRVLKLLSLSLYAASIGMLFCAPLLFEVAFQNKFAGGLVVLPWTLAYCSWFGTIAVAQNYLWCAERPGQSCVALLAGLALNIGLNHLLLPAYGLEGAVWATTVANLTALVLVYVFSSRRGMHVDLGTWILSLAPLTLGLGPRVSLGVLIAIVVVSVCSTSIFTRQEKQQMTEALAQLWERLRRIRGKFSRTATT